MLVKFLSYTASVIGTARTRHRPVVLSSLIVMLSLTAITSVLLFKDDVASRTPASSVEKPLDDNSSNATPKLGSSDSKQNTKDQAAQAQPETNQSNPSASQDTTAQTDTNKATPAMALTVSSDTISVSQSGESEPLAVTAANTSKVTWSIAPEQQEGVQLVVTAKNTVSATLHARASDAAVSGSTHQFVLTVTDTATGKTITKTISVTVR